MRVTLTSEEAVLAVKDLLSEEAMANDFAKAVAECPLPLETNRQLHMLAHGFWINGHSRAIRGLTRISDGAPVSLKDNPTTDNS